MLIKTSNAVLGSFTFLLLSAIFIILHNLVSFLLKAEEPFFFSLVFISILAFFIFTTIVLVKLFMKFIKPRLPIESQIHDETSSDQEVMQSQELPLNN